ncbi:MAG: HD domain-containing protein [Bradymonadaceae bacterium]
MSYTTRFDDALIYTSAIHRHQKRKATGIPYITHLLAVASLVGVHGGTEDQVIGGLLHDAIEDCIDKVPEIRTQIGSKFGQTVLDIVEACTDADTIPKPPWRERKLVYIKHVQDADPRAPFLLVSLADKVHNAQSIVQDLRVMKEELWTRFKGKREGSIWYYESLSDAFATQAPGPLADELARLVEEMNRLG